MDRTSAPAPRTGSQGRPWWLLILPAVFLAHIGEEVFAGEGFAVWTGRIFGSPLGAARYAAINLVGWPAFLILTVVAIVSPRLRWLAATLATMLLVNAGLHGFGTLYTWSYSPGLVTALLLYPAPCIAALRMIRRTQPAAFGLAVIVGIALHAVVMVAAFA